MELEYIPGVVGVTISISEECEDERDFVYEDDGDE